jgi:hypothetical protein
MAFHNFIRDSALYNDDFENYEDDFLEDFHDDVSIGLDEYDMGAFCDTIAAALLSGLFLVRVWRSSSLDGL